MRLACPNCQTQYKIDPSNFPEKVIQFRCTKCSKLIHYAKEKAPETIEVDKIDQSESEAPPRTDAPVELLEPEEAAQTEEPIQVESTKPEPPVPDDSTGRRKKILVADDETSICILVEEILTGAGYTVLTATDGLEAFEKVSLEKPDLLILDLLMPKMTGFEVLKELRKENQNIPVLVMTAIYKKASQVLVVKELGANGYLEKPFSPDHLLFRVENLLLEKTTKSLDRS